jgi:hypothetical protein
MLAGAGAARHGRTPKRAALQKMSTSTVGLPRESRISRPMILLMEVFAMEL